MAEKKGLVVVFSAKIASQNPVISLLCFYPADKPEFWSMIIQNKIYQTESDRW